MGHDTDARLLLVTASARHMGSVSRSLAANLVAGLGRQADPGTLCVVERDLASTPAPLVDAGWVAANFTRADERTEANRAALAGSDVLVAELQAADTLVLATPIYNFGVPAALKAWIDQVTRVGETFRYGAQGPIGLAAPRRAFLVVSSGGTVAGSPMDFATPYLGRWLEFVGIDAVTTIASTGGDTTAAEQQIAALAEAG